MKFSSSNFKLEVTSSSEETVVQVQEEKTIVKVLVAIDESEGSLYALQWALQNIPLRKSRGDAAAPVEEEPPVITVVHAQPPFQQTFIASPHGPGELPFKLEVLANTS
ncbi:hypothetical protein L6452_11334 [Arctium lappa]|uniref:Uncharacterized protein n=1 Tax=Arctium lappa TaxID=4217 RepID=A0ACB9DPW0_ARCLA|nr:hypothetical protein L6452_11334 [Arctium lappa]